MPEIEIEDTNMKEEGEVSAGPDKATTAFESLAAESDREEGEEDEADRGEPAEGPPKLDEMDVS